MRRLERLGRRVVGLREHCGTKEEAPFLQQSPPVWSIVNQIRGQDAGRELQRAQEKNAGGSGNVLP